MSAPGKVLNQKLIQQSNFNIKSRHLPTIVKSFKHEKHQSDPELSNELWNIKNNKYTPKVLWEILRKHQPYSLNTKRCSLCLNEKLEIARYKRHNLLHKRSEIINKCHHRNKFALGLYDGKDLIKFSVIASEKQWVRSHSFQKSDCFASS